MTQEIPSPETIGIGQALVQDFFPKLESDRESAISSFGNDAVLFFQGQERTGGDQIADFIRNLPSISLKISAYEAQTVPNSDLWSMIVVMGSISFEGESKIHNFHSAVYVESRTEDHTAFIRYQSFVYF